MKTNDFKTIGTLAAISATILLLSAGLCGIQFHFQPNEYVTIEGIIGFAGLILGAAGLIATLLAGFIQFIASRFTSPKDPQ